MKLIAVLLLSIFVSACGSSEHVDLSAGTERAITSISNDIESSKELSKSVVLSESNLQKALRNITLKFYSRLPSVEEKNKVIAGGYEAYKQFVVELLSSESFESVIHSENKKLYQMAGSEGGVNYNEPANLTTYIIKNDIDFREVMTADYCVSNKLEKKDCANFPSADVARDEAAGVLTTKAFLKKWVSAFNFRRTSMAFQAFGCSEYPDQDDSGVTLEEIEEKHAEFACTTCTPQCYSCHRSMNPRAVLFYSFDNKGQFNLNPTKTEATLTITNNKSVPTDLLKEGSPAVYKGEEVTNLREFAVKFSNSKTFNNCVAKRFTNLVLGEGHMTALPPKLRYLTERVKPLGYKVKPFLLEVLTSDEFISNR